MRSSEWREPAAVARRLHTSTTSISWSVEAVEAAGATYATPLQNDPEYTKIPILLEKLWL